MRLITVFAFAAAVAAAPAIDPGVPRFPLPDGFPTPNPDQLAEIQRLAGGTLPNQPLPTNLSQDAIATLKLLAHNELYEVAFFTELLNNITTAALGYGANDTAPLDRLLLVCQIEAIKNVSIHHPSSSHHDNPSTSKKSSTPSPPTPFSSPRSKSPSNPANTSSPSATSKTPSSSPKSSPTSPSAPSPPSSSSSLATAGLLPATSSP